MVKKSKAFTRALLVSAFFMNVGGSAVLTFMVIYLSHSLHFTAWQVGTVLTANILCQRILPIVTGVIGDKLLSHHRLIVFGYLVRGVGFLGYAVVHSFVGLVMCSCCVGVGGALYSPAMSAVFAAQNDKRLFTIFNQLLNAGIIVGPIVGGALMRWNQEFVFLLGATVSISIGIVLIFFKIPKTHSPQNLSHPKRMIGTHFVRVLKNKPFIFLMIWMMMFWILWQQFIVSLPIRAYQISGNASFISQLYSWSGIIGLVLMFLLRKQFEVRSSTRLIRIGLLFITLGWTLLPLFNQAIWVMFCVFIFMIGETIVLPSEDITVAELGESQAMGAYYGVTNLVNGIGGILGSYIGSLLMDLGGRETWPWLIYGGIGLLATISFPLQAIAKDSKRILGVNETHRSA